MVAAAKLDRDPTAFWNGPAAERWVRMLPELDAMVAPFGEAGMDAAQVRPGEQVLDLGCGCGTTSIDLAMQTGPTGHVVGVDVSTPMIAVARERVAAAGLANVELICADAATLELPRAYDVLYSRFGSMFFPDPVPAFAHLRRAAKPEARLSLVVWRSLAENDWALVPLDAVRPLIPIGRPSPPDAPGPFSLSDPDRVRAILGAAGWREIQLTQVDDDIPLGTAAGLDAAIEHAMNMGPAARALIDAGAPDDPALQARARTALRDAFSPHLAHGAVRLHGSTWIVTARPA